MSRMITCPACGTRAPLVSLPWECPKCGIMVATTDTDLSRIPDLGFVTFEIGTKGQLRRMTMRESVARFVKRAADATPGVPFALTIGGYEFDPREIPDIPEARDYLLGWAALLEQEHGITPDRFLEETQTLIACCLLKATGRGDMVAVGPPLSPEELVRQINAYRKKVN